MTSATSLAELLPWAVLFDAGKVLTKRGQILVGYWLRPPDASSQTDEETDKLSSDVNGATRMFGTGWTSWADVISIPAGRYPDPDESHFPDPFSRAVDNERRRMFEAKDVCLENERALLLCYTPPPRSVSRLTDLFFTDNSAKKRPVHQQILTYVEHQLSRFENQIGQPLRLRRMTDFEVENQFGQKGRQDELLNYLYYCATGKIQGIILPKSGADIDLLVSSQDLWPGERPVIGPDYVSTVVIDGLPAETEANIIAGLSTLPFPYRFSQRMIYLDPVHATKALARYRNKWKQQQTGLAELILQNGKSPINEHAAAMTVQANTAIAWAESGLVKWGYYSPVIVLRHRDADVLNGWTKDVSEIIASCGYGVRIEDTNTTEAWRGAMPGETYCNVRQPPIHTQTAADLMPLSGVWTGDEFAPCPLYPPGSPALLWAITDGAIPFRLNLHIGPNGDVGHTLIAGPSGMGKSTLANLIAVQSLRYPRMHITVYDLKYSMAVAAWACGGNHHDVLYEAGHDGLYCPLAHLEDEGDVDWAIDYMFTLYALAKNEPASSELRIEITRAITDDLRHRPPSRRSISDFVQAVQDTDARTVFSHYQSNGPAGRFLDGRYTGETARSRFTVNEMQGLMGLGEITSLPVLLHLFRDFERTLDGEPHLLFISEAWQAFRHPMWSRRIDEDLRRLRSKNCAVVMDTQSLGDAARSDILPLIAENCPRKIMLANPQAFNSTGQKDNPGSYELYKAFAYNDNQIGIIQNLQAKREYYVTGPDGCRRVSLGLSPLELAVLGATDEGSVKAIRAMREEQPERWLHLYLNSKGVDYPDHSHAQERAYA